MKITVIVVIRGSQYTIETEGVAEGAEDIKRAIAELENPNIVNPVKIEH